MPLQPYLWCLTLNDLRNLIDGIRTACGGEYGDDGDGCDSQGGCNGGEGGDGGDGDDGGDGYDGGDGA